MVEDHSTNSKNTNPIKKRPSTSMEDGTQLG
jgi:hypothetical protein